MGRGRKIVDIDIVAEEAVVLIEEDGVEELSTRRLASRLGISAMTLYNYYENRRAIIEGALNFGLGMLVNGLSEEVDAWLAGGGNALGAYRVLASHTLSFAVTRPRLCRFILTEMAVGSGNAREDQIDKICDPKGAGLRSEHLGRDIYLFELLIFALALKVVGGGETPQRFRELATEGYDRLIGRHETAPS